MITSQPMSLVVSVFFFFGYGRIEFKTLIYKEIITRLKVQRIEALIKVILKSNLEKEK